MHNLTGFHTLDGRQKSRNERAIIFHPVFPDMDDHDTKTQLLEVVFVLKTLINSDKNITLTLCLSNQFGIRKRAPLGFCDRQHLMVREGMPEAWIDTLV